MKPLCLNIHQRMELNPAFQQKPRVLQSLQSVSFAGELIVDSQRTAFAGKKAMQASKQKLWKLFN